MVRDSDEDSNDPSGPNVRVGGGGTLLRSAVRQSFKKTTSNNVVRYSNSSAETTDTTPELVRHQVLAQVHSPDTSSSSPHHLIDPLSAEFETNLQPHEEESLPLPPPPRDESLDRLAPPEDLPPPPPELYEEQQQQQQHLPSHLPPQAPSCQMAPPPLLPPQAAKPLPPSLKKNFPSPCPSPKRASQQTQRKISFDDNVQMIESDFFPRRNYPQPKQLYGQDYAALSQAAPPTAFLTDLQRVMNKKWQIAEKCKLDTQTSPHQVLGFRDEVQHLVGQPQCYSRDESVGAWVIQSQQYQTEPAVVPMSRRSPSPPPPPPPPVPQQQNGHMITEPLYAISMKQQQQHQQHQSPSHYAPSHIRQGSHGQMQLQQQLQQQRPVILREPTPEYDPYATLTDVHNMAGTNGHSNGFHQPERNDVSNYSTLNFNNQMNGMLNGQQQPLNLSPAHRVPFNNGGKRSPAPPPPKRSENTQLSTTMAS